MEKRKEYWGKVLSSELTIPTENSGGGGRGIAECPGLPF